MAYEKSARRFFSIRAHGQKFILNPEYAKISPAPETNSVFYTWKIDGWKMKVFFFRVCC